MNLSNNQKILLGLAIGGGIAWWLSRGKSTATKSASAPSEVEPESLTREQKIAFILDNIDATPSEETSGFSGDRFEFNPRLGYMMPVGKVDETYAGQEMIVPKEGNLANDVFFNAEGEETDNPVKEAEGILDSLTERELNVAFKIARAKRSNPNISDEQLAEISKLDKEGKGLFFGLIKNKLNDIKAMKKHPNWKKGLLNRKSKEERQEARESRKEARAERKEARAEYKDMRFKGEGRKDFVSQVTNREGGSMWGGYRNDGKPTNANAYSRGNQPNQRGRG